MFGGGLLNQHTHFIGTCEADEIDVGMVGQCRASFFAQTAHDIQSPPGETCLQREFCDTQTTQTSVFSRLDHHCVAHGQSRCNAAPHHLRGVIPRNDVRCDAQRFAQ